MRQVVALTGQAIATSSTQLRTWQTEAGPAHHSIDPRTGQIDMVRRLGSGAGPEQGQLTLHGVAA